MKLTQQSIDILQKVKQHILEEPRRLRMTTWFYKTDLVDPMSPPCGTIGCIAGFTVMLSGKIVEVETVQEEAMELLGINDKQAGELFYTSQWPQRFSTEYFDYGWASKERAEVTARRIDAFIEQYGNVH